MLAAGPGFLFVDDAGSVRELAQPEDGRSDVRMNDGACDPQGRFWAGTMAYDESPGAGALFRLELDGSCTTVLTGLTISNGIGSSPDASTMYLNDSGTGCVEAFRFDGPSGAISDRRTLVHVDQPGVVPDGLTINEEGGIWVALWNGGPSTGTHRMDRFWPACSSRSSDRPHARSAGPAGTRCSSLPPGPTSTTTRWPASRTQARYSRSMDSASAAFPACHTTAGHHVRPIARRADRGGGACSPTGPRRPSARPMSILIRSASAMRLRRAGCGMRRPVNSPCLPGLDSRRSSCTRP